MEGAARGPAACYDYWHAIAILMRDSHMDEETAIEYFDFNVVGACVGEHTPLFLYDWRRVQEPEPMEGASNMKHVTVELTAQEVACLTDPIRQSCALLLSVLSDDGSTQVTLVIPQAEAAANGKPKANGKRTRRPKVEAKPETPPPPPPKTAKAGASVDAAGGGDKKT